MEHRHQHTRSGARLWTVLVIALGLVAASCTTPPNTPTPANQQFCQLFEDTVDEPPEAGENLLVAEDVVAAAAETAVVGGRCTETGARIEMDDARLAEGEERLATLEDPGAEKVAVVTGGRSIRASGPVLQNVAFRTLSASITSAGIQVHGAVDIRLSGAVSTISFTGTVQNLANWSITLASSSLSIPGITSSPATFYGAVVVHNGVPTLSLQATVASAQVGDISIEQAAINLTASPQQVAASVSGTLEFGPATVNGDVSISFDSNGTLVNATADVTARLQGIQADGSSVDLVGDVQIDGNGDESTILFSATGNVGPLVVNSASGILTLSGDVAQFDGTLDVAVGPGFLRYNGSILFDGSSATPLYMHVAAGSEFTGTLDNGDSVSVSGVVETTIGQGNQIVTTVSGDVEIGRLTGLGSARIENRGQLTVLYVDAQLAMPEVQGQITGVIELSAGRAVLVELDAQIANVSYGDLSVTDASVHVHSRYGSPLELTVGGDFAVGTLANGSAALDMSIGTDGSLLSLRGEVAAELNLDGVQIDATAVLAATPESLSITADGTVQVWHADIAVHGALVVDLGSPRWNFEGTADVSLGPINQPIGIRITQDMQDGFQTVEFNFYAKVALTTHNISAKLFLHPNGEFSHMDMKRLIGPLLDQIIANALSDAMGIPVNPA